jgi:hypothetical protein
MTENLVIIGQVSLFSVLLTLVTVYLNHLLANTREKVKLRRNHGQGLVTAFKPELDTIIQTDQDCRLILTEEAYRRHESAIRAFMPYLSWIERIRLKRAWTNFALIKMDKEHQTPFYEQYVDFGSLTKRRRVRPIAIDGIQKIVSFAHK